MAGAVEQRWLFGPGIRVVMDKNEVYPDDPGRGVPVMVYGRGEKCATYEAAIGERELIDQHGNVQRLSERQVDWLERVSDQIDAFFGWPVR